MYAVTPSPLGWRTINDGDPINSDEVIVPSIPDGCTDSTNSVWDSSLNNGTGGVRLMTAAESASYQQQQTTVNNQVAFDKNTILQIYKTATATNPPTTLTNDQLTKLVIPFIRDWVEGRLS
jgi:hypothetical protein